MEKSIQLLWKKTGKQKDVITKHGREYIYIECICVCGIKKYIRIDTFNNSSFGCKRCRDGKRIHGESRKTRLYNIWAAMKQRCYYKKHVSPSYRKNKIIVCDEWKDNFVNFRDWALNNGYQDNLSIDRIDNLGNYSPENCRWANADIQNRNKSSNIVWFEHNGEKMCLKDWCRRLNINYDYTRRKIYNGSTIRKALGL